LVTQFDVFINSSFVAPGVQADILNSVIQQWTESDIKGHVITIGTTLENSVDTRFQTYIDDKKKLRELSLSMNDRTGITGVKTSYIVVGGINNQQPQNVDFVDPQSVVELIDWVLKFPDQLALIQLEKSKVVKQPQL
jgi:NADP-dependent 3-hydroxy acid dehydrogenase YdfG